MARDNGRKGVPRYGVHHGGRGSSSTVGEREKRAVVCVQSVQSEAIVTITHQASQPIFPPLRGLFNGFNDLWVQRRFSQMGRAGVHRPSYPILSAWVGRDARGWRDIGSQDRALRIVSSCRNSMAANRERERYVFRSTERSHDRSQSQFLSITALQLYMNVTRSALVTKPP